MKDPIPLIENLRHSRVSEEIAHILSKDNRFTNHYIRDIQTVVATGRFRSPLVNAIARYLLSPRGDQMGMEWARRFYGPDAGTFKPGLEKALKGNDKQ